MKKSFFVVPALLVAGIFAASCSFNSVSPDMSFRLEVPRSADGGSVDYNCAVYVTGRSEPWRAVVSRENNVITLDGFPLGKGNTMYLGLWWASLGSSTYDGTFPVGYFGQTVVDVSDSESSMDLNVKSIEANGLFELPVGETQTLTETVGNMPSANQNGDNASGRIQIYDLPADMLSDKGELYMCSFTYRVGEYEGPNANEPTYGPEVYAECPAWLISHALQCSIKVYNLPGCIEITNVKLRRWADRTWHECEPIPDENNNAVSNSPEWKFTW